ncbi:MAG: hypothetical protein QOD74_2186 [Variibacter sp.]|jgi:hypothetical protein|nr:hypothetical protein [Variibacter sp.]
MPDAAEAVCVAAQSPWIGINVSIPAQHMVEALKSPDAVQAALALGRLDLMSALLGIVALIVAVAGLMGFGWIRYRAHAIARDEARAGLPASVTAVLSGESGAAIFRAALVHPQVLATIQARILELGIGNAPEAAVVDTDAEHPETSG